MSKTIEYKLTWNYLIDSLRPFAEGEAVGDVIDLIANFELQEIGDETIINIYEHTPLRNLYKSNKAAVILATKQFKKTNVFKIATDEFTDLMIDERMELLENEIDNIHYFKDIPQLKDIIEEEGPPTDEPPTDEPPTDEPPTDEPPTDGRLPLFKTQKDFLPLNIFQNPQELNKQLKDQLQQKNFSEYAKAGHIDVPYLIGTDNINRLYNNNKLHAELRNGTLNNIDRIKQWHKDKRLALLNKYDTYKEPIKIKHPFNN